MNTLKKLIVLMGLMSVLCALPTMAQITNQVTFEAPSAFFVGNAKMPAGKYTVTQPDPDNGLLLIEDASGSHAAFMEYTVATSDSPHAETDVSFNKYGDTDFLSAIWIKGRHSEMRIIQSKVEQNAAKTAAAENHSLTAQSAGQP